VLDLKGRTLLMNDAARGWAAEGLLLGDARTAYADGRIKGLRRRALAGEVLDGVDMDLTATDGAVRNVQVWTAPVQSDDKLDAVVSVFADVTQQRQGEERVRFLAEHDALTGLLNRRGLQANLEHTSALTRAGTCSALAILDLDNFGLINDSAGHQTGDRVLVGIARALAGALRADDVLARLSGDEFGVILNRAESAEIYESVKGLLKAAHQYRLVSGEASISVTASIGVCQLAQQTSAIDALAHADIALHEAKEQGRNRSVVWTDAHDRTELHEVTLDWSTRIKDALDEDRFHVYLQPIVDLATGEIVRYEGLARLRGRDGSISLPGDFIPAAVRLGLMTEIDRVVLDKVVVLMQENESLRISMNLDAASFDDDELLDRLERTLNDDPALAGRFGIEITEHTSLRNALRAKKRLQRLRDLGCEIAIDDFGTGFASFAHLRELPADIVKISQSFVENVDTDPGAAALVEAIVTVSRALGKEVVAEGVRTRELAAFLRAYDIAFAQGYFFGVPAPPESITVDSTQAVCAA
jgi:diguanylate cyclase (GGDEF)-like protein